MPLTVKELNHVAIHVRDLDASVHFYKNILALPMLPRPNFNFRGAWFALGNQELHLIEDDAISPDERHHHHFALRIEDTYQARECLESKGYKTFRSHGLRPDGAVQLFFYDPDGYLIEMYSAPPALLAKEASVGVNAGEEAERHPEPAPHVELLHAPDDIGNDANKELFGDHDKGEDVGPVG